MSNQIAEARDRLEFARLESHKRLQQERDALEAARAHVMAPLDRAFQETASRHTQVIRRLEEAYQALTHGGQVEVPSEAEILTALNQS